MYFYISPNEPYDFIETSKNRWHTAYVRRLIAEAKQNAHKLQLVSMVGNTVESLIKEKTILETASVQYQKSIDDKTGGRQIFHLIEGDGWNCFVLTISFGSLFFFQKNKGGIIYHATKGLLERFAQFDFHPANYHPHYFVGGFEKSSHMVDNSFYDQDAQIRAAMVERVNWVLFNDEPEKVMSQDEAFLFLAKEAYELVSDAKEIEAFNEAIRQHPDLFFLEDISPMVVYLAQFFTEYEEIKIIKGIGEGKYATTTGDYKSVCDIVESHLSTKRNYHSNLSREYQGLRDYILNYGKKSEHFKLREEVKQ